MEVPADEPLTQRKRAVLGVLPALAIGSTVMMMHGAPWTVPAANLAAAGLAFLILAFAGAPLSAVIARRPLLVSAVVLGLQSATLGVPGAQGVQRWLPLGSMRLHAAAATEPLLVLALARLWCGPRAWLALPPTLLALGLHVRQPDAGQATALALGVLVLAARPDAPARLRWVLALAAMVGLSWAWLRPDPLAPVDLTENIVSMAFALQPWLGALSLAGLAMLPVAALMPGGCQAQGRALAGYLCGSLLAAGLGTFPVPVLGFGAAPILGAVLGLGSCKIRDTRLIS